MLRGNENIRMKLYIYVYLIAAEENIFYVLQGYYRLVKKSAFYISLEIVDNLHFS